MRIGIDLTGVWRPATGMENRAIEMTRALLRNDRKHRYVLFFTQTIHPAFEKFAGQCEVVLAPRAHEAVLKNLWFPRAPAVAGLDFMHFPGFPPPPWFPAAQGWIVADATPWLYPETMKLSSRWYFRILGGRAARNTSVLVTDTEASREDLVRTLGVRRERLHVIYPGVKPIFRPLRDPVVFESVRQRYGLPEEFILFVGTLEPRKNLARLLRGFRKLRTERNFAPGLVIVGRKGWLCDPIFSELTDPELKKAVTLTGYVPDEDLVALYNMARLLAFPSLYEGFGVPPVEAMACGCPVVTSNRGALLEITGDCALHADPEDVEDIAAAIWKVCENPSLREKLITDGLGQASRFSWERYAERFLTIVEQSVRGSDGSRLE